MHVWNRVVESYLTIYFPPALKDEMTILHYAVEGDHIDLCLKLLEMGADVTARDGVSVCIILRAILLDSLFFSRTLGG